MAKMPALGAYEVYRHSADITPTTDIPTTATKVNELRGHSMAFAADPNTTYYFFVRFRNDGNGQFSDWINGSVTTGELAIREATAPLSITDDTVSLAFDDTQFEVNESDELAIIALAWSLITGKPTTLAGYGITNALALAGGTMTGDLRFTKPASIWLDGTNGRLLLAIEDGTGRWVIKWNATRGTSETAITGDHCFRLRSTPSDPTDSLLVLEYGGQPGAGNPITWATVLELGNGLFEYNGDALAVKGAVTALTDSSGGTATDTISAVSGSGADTAINDNIASLAAKIEELRALLDNS
ncbi:hypothetical protein FF098_014865 [Parvularcula flava]|uniref:Tail fiber protein n=1 Tax=Aquisalinus luteolus TaxID=1566827 RepID=A0ABX0HRC9_9PROT|nr:hypothetical protein [Aquisalinus luteolus]NHK29200.1 hypothetical protein [Aquisalinus luteolus]